MLNYQRVNPHLGWAKHQKLVIFQKRFCWVNPTTRLFGAEPVLLSPCCRCFSVLAGTIRKFVVKKHVILAHKAWTLACTKPLSLVHQAPLFCNRNPIFAMLNMLLWHFSLFNQLSNFAICFRKHSINNTFQSGVNTRKVT